MVKLNKSLVNGSIILLVTFGIFNAFGYLFHLLMTRMLSVSEYGILAVLFSIIYILTLFSESIQTVIAKYSASESNSGKLKNIFKKTLRKGFLGASLLFIVYAIASVFLSSILDISYSLLLLNGLIIFTIFLMPIGRGVMQGRRMFLGLGINMILEAVFKVGLSVLLVFIGWKVYGAIAGVILATVLAFIFSFFQLKVILKAKEEKAHTEKIYQYTTPVFIIIFSVLIFFSLDVIIARIVFDSLTAGYYAILSMLGKIIFFGTQPISKVMFALSSEKKSIKDSENVFSSAIAIVIGLILGVLIVMFFFPELLIKIFSGKVIPLELNILFIVGIAISLISLANLSLLYKISVGKVKGAFYLPLFIIVEILLLTMFSDNLLQFSLAFVTSSAILLWGSTILLRK